MAGVAASRIQSAKSGRIMVTLLSARAVLRHLAHEVTGDAGRTEAAQLVQGHAAIAGAGQAPDERGSDVERLERLGVIRALDRDAEAAHLADVLRGDAHRRASLGV